MIKKMRGYVAPSAPLNFELCDGTEEGLRLVTGFTVNWFYKRVGVCFNKQYHTDPYFRFKEIEKMHNYLIETFPTVHYFQEHDLMEECAAITGVYATCPVAMAYGMEPVYQDYDWPAVHPKDRFRVEKLAELKHIDVASTPVGENLLRQIEIIGREWGKCSGYLNYQGVLGTAFKLAGDELLVDMLDEPEKTDLVFRHVADTMLDMIKVVQNAQRATGFPTADTGLYTCISKCTANLISPDLYEKAILPYDQHIADALTYTGVHTCNWVVDKLIGKLAKINRLGYIDFSIQSNLDLVQQLLPQARKLAFYSPSDLMKYTDEELHEQLYTFKSKFGSCDICLCDMDVNTPDEQLVRFANMVDKVSLER